MNSRDTNLTSKQRKVTIFSWAIYDFANTIFSMNVISLYFALWVTVDMKGADILYGMTLSVSMFLAAICSPVLGALSDQLKKRMPFLIVFALFCCVFTALIGFVHQLFWGLLLFAGANFCYQVAEVFYNALLPQVADEASIGKVSGFGVGLGYLGTIIGLMLVSPFVLKYGRQAAFLPTAGYFLLFALPCFIFVKDIKTRTKNRFNILKGFRQAFLQIKTTVIHVRRYSNLFIFFLGAFVAFNAVITAYIFMSVYIKKMIGFSDQEMIVFYVVCSIFAIMGSLAAGFLADKFGAKKILLKVLLLWCLALLLAIFSVNEMSFWAVGILAGISLGATWTSARALLIQLSPPEMVGEMFGFYGLIGRSASIVGPLVWGGSVWLFGFLGILKYRITVFIFFLLILAGFMILRKIQD